MYIRMERLQTGRVLEKGLASGWKGCLMVDPMALELAGSSNTGYEHQEIVEED